VARLGDALRERREHKGVTMQQAAEDTRIREKFLQAIESGDYQSLPGAVYTKGFLRNYARYLGLEPEEMLALYTGERGGSDPARTFAPMRPLVKRSFIFTPTVLVPVIVLGGILLFIAYFYYQFTSFAVAPHVDITDPPGDAVSGTAEYLVKGKTNPDRRITVSVSPGLDALGDVKPAADGTFSVSVPLKPGPNHIEVRVLDAAGKLATATRTIARSFSLATETVIPVPAGAYFVALCTSPATTSAVRRLSPRAQSGAPARGPRSVCLRAIGAISRTADTMPVRRSNRARRTLMSGRSSFTDARIRSTS